MRVDWTKPLVTKNGRSARLIKKLNLEGRPLRYLVAVSYYGVWEMDYTYNEIGHIPDGNSNIDLQNRDK